MDNQQIDGAAPLAPAIIQPNANANANANAVNRIHVRVPPFWKLNPQLWFKQIEAQFANSAINNDLTKYNTIVGVIDSDVLTSVSDIVLDPPNINLYETLKQRLIKNFTDSDNKKLDQLLHDLTLGDTKPSDLLRRMRAISCGKVSDELLKTLWIQRLPATLQAILSSSSDQLPQLVIMADKIFDVTEISRIQAVSTSKPHDLVNVICNLEDKIESLQNDFRESRSSTKSTSRRRVVNLLEIDHNRYHNHDPNHPTQNFVGITTVTKTKQRNA